MQLINYLTPNETIVTVYT